MDYIEKARAKQQAIIDDLTDLIAIPSLRDVEHKSENAPFGPAIRQALDYMLDKAKADGFQVEDVDGYAGVISYGEGQESVSMLGHLDIVPVGKGWSKDPFGSEIEDGFLYGRGSGDDKGPTVAAYQALKIIKESGIPLKRKIMLILGTDEESGMECMEYFKENYTPQPTMGFVPDANFPVIYGEKGILSLVISGHKESVIKEFKAGERSNIVIGEAQVLVDGPLNESAFEIYLKQHHLEGYCEGTNETSRYFIKGKYFHGSQPYCGINAAVHLFSFVGGVYNDDVALGLSKVLSNDFGQGLNVYFEGSHMGNLTMNVGIVNIEASQIDITLDIRYPHDIDALTIYEKAKAVVDGLNINCSIKLCGDSAPLFVDPQSELVKTCMESYQSISGDYATPALTMGGGTYARVLDNHVAFGSVFPLRDIPSKVGGPHEKDEAVEIESLVLATAIYAKTLEKLAG